MRAYITSSVMDKNQDHRSMNSGDLKDKGQVPSTRVRQALAIGDVNYVSELLVHQHRLISTVGDQKLNLLKPAVDGESPFQSPIYRICER
jgi:FAD synthase